jgi:hypothetical protein
MKKLALFVALALGCINLYAQDDLFGKEGKTPPRKGFIIGVNGGLDFPAGDMARRFGTNFRLGGSVSYKTTNNWIFGPKFDFILGNNIKEDSLMANMKNSSGELIDQNGKRIKPNIAERGYMIGIQAGKIISLSSTNSDNGILIQTGIGFIQHKISIFDAENAIPQIRGDYKKGYDRLTNGLYLEQYVGYNYFAKNGLINFHIGLDLMAGFTQGRREYLFDVRRTDDKSRVDVLFGLRGGWYIPLFKRKSEDYYFE